MTSISQSSVFALYPGLYIFLTLYFLIISLYDPKFDLKINFSHSDLYFTGK